MAIPIASGRECDRSVASEGQKSVLLIEDDRELRTLLAEFLDTQGWTVLQADDGETGLALARQARPAAIICDLLLPRVNGFQVCSAVREEPALAQIRVLAISGRGYAANQQMALQAGADDFLAKPVRPMEVHEALERLVRELGTRQRPARAVESAQGTMLKFWGVRGSVPVPGPATVHFGGNTSCIEVRADGELIVLDCGTGARGLGQKLAAEYKDQPLALTILISHTHWDHIQGFPFFLPAYESKNHIRILGYEGARSGLAGVLAGQMESPYFPISLKELPGNIEIKELKDLQFQIGKVRVQAAFMNHPGICMGYRLFTSDGSIAYLPDNEPFYSPDPAAEAGPTVGDDLEFARAEDGKMIEFIREADMLIMDAQYDAEEYKAHTGWGHGCVDEVVRLALQARVKKLLLFHHDPGHDDQKVAAMTDHARRIVAERKGDLQVEGAREGAEFRFRPGPSLSTGGHTSRLLKKRVLGR